MRARAEKEGEMIAENFTRIICPHCGCVNGHDPSCSIVVLYGHTATNGPTDLYSTMDWRTKCVRGHQWRYWFGDAETIGYCTLCEIARLINPPVIISSTNTSNKEIKP